MISTAKTTKTTTKEKEPPKAKAPLPLPRLKKAENKKGEVKPQKERVSGKRPRGDCSINGKVVSAETGKPVANARVYLFYTKTFCAIFINTASDGTFHIKDIPEGPFSLQVSRTSGYQDASYDPEGKQGQFPQFSLKKGEQRSGIVFKIKPAFRITGKVLDEKGEVPKDVDTLIVRVWYKDDGKKQYDREVYTCVSGSVNSKDGSYSIDGLDGSPVYVMAINVVVARKEKTYPPAYYPSTRFREDAKLITFGEKPHVDKVNITLKEKSGLTLKGTVRDEDGKPIPEAFFVAHRQDMYFNFVTAYSDKQGNYEIQGLDSGDILVHIDAAHRGFVRRSIPTTLNRKDQETQLDPTLIKGATIIGKLVDEQGRPWKVNKGHGSTVINNIEVPKDRKISVKNIRISGYRNKHLVPERLRGCGVSGGYNSKDGNYLTGEMTFPTKSSFMLQGIMPGSTKIIFSPIEEGQTVKEILYKGKDITKSGIETKPGEVIKDVTIVIGKE